MNEWMKNRVKWGKRRVLRKAFSQQQVPKAMNRQQMENKDWGREIMWYNLKGEKVRKPTGKYKIFLMLFDSHYTAHKSSDVRRGMSYHVRIWYWSKTGHIDISLHLRHSIYVTQQKETPNYNDINQELSLLNYNVLYGCEQLKLQPAPHILKTWNIADESCVLLWRCFLKLDQSASTFLNRKRKLRNSAWDLLCVSHMKGD